MKDILESFGKLLKDSFLNGVTKAVIQLGDILKEQESGEEN